MEKVEVKLLKPVQVIKETLERIGIANRKDRKLYPSCYVIQENGKYYICHFKELLKTPKLEEIDVKRKNTILWLLSKWNLISVAPEIKSEINKNILEKKIFILAKNQMIDEQWECVHKYHGLEQTKKVKKEEAI